MAMLEDNRNPVRLELRLNYQLDSAYDDRLPVCFPICLNMRGFLYTHEEVEQIMTLLNQYRATVSSGLIESYNARIADHLGQDERLRLFDEIQNVLDFEPSAVRRQSERGFIYVLKFFKRYKIGKSKNPSERVQSLSLGNQAQLVCVKEFVNYHDVEKHLHCKFHSKRISGEWYRLDDNDIAYIENLTLSAVFTVEGVR